MQRPYKVKVRAQDVKGVTLMLTLEGWQARIFQHEYDHLQVSNMHALSGFSTSLFLLRFTCQCEAIKLDRKAAGVWPYQLCCLC